METCESKRNPCKAPDLCRDRASAVFCQEVTVRAFTPKAAAMACNGPPKVSKVTTRMRVVGSILRPHKGVPRRAEKVFWQVVHRQRFLLRSCTLRLPAPITPREAQARLGHSCRYGGKKVMGLVARCCEMPGVNPLSRLLELHSKKSGPLLENLT